MVSCAKRIRPFTTALLGVKALRKYAAVFVSACLILSTAPILPVLAAVPQRIIYQGKIGNSSGRPLNGTFSFRFKYFDAETGGTELFREDWTGADAVTVSKGVYEVHIGSLTTGGIPAGVFSGDIRFLEIDVNPGSTLTGAETLAPREALGASAFTMHAWRAETLGTGSVISTHTATGDLEVAGAITKLGGAALASALNQVNWDDLSDGGATTLHTHTGLAPGAHAASHQDGGADVLTGTLAVSSITASASASAANFGALVVSTHIYQTSGNLLAAGRVGIGVTKPGSPLEVKGGSFLYPNTDGARAIALSLGQFSDSSAPLLDIYTDDATGDNVEFNINRWAADFKFSRGSPDGDQSIVSIHGNDVDQRVDFYDSTTETVLVRFGLNGGNSYINTGANLGIGTTSPQRALDVNGGLLIASSFTVKEIAAPLVSNAGEGSLYFDSTSKTFRMSQNGAAYQDVSLGAHSSGGHGDGADCAAGNSPLGVDASGAVQGCFDVTTQTELTTHIGVVDAHIDHADTLAELNAQIGSGLVTGAHTTDTNTNANTICAAGQFLEGDGTCTDVLEELELDTLAELNAQLTDATLVTGAHTADTNTNANTICAAGQFLEGDGTCTDVLEELELDTLAEL
ncbi:MAG: hypothetical protein COA57_16165, partial [Flavobacteriales bacterium]